MKKFFVLTLIFIKLQYTSCRENDASLHVPPESKLFPEEAKADIEYKQVNRLLCFQHYMEIETDSKPNHDFACKEDETGLLLKVSNSARLVYYDCPRVEKYKFCAGIRQNNDLIVIMDRFA